MTDGLDKAALFAGLSEDALADLRRIATPFAANAGETLFRQGDPPTGLYLVESGLLEIATRLPGDEEAKVSAIGPGEVVGEFALLDPGPRSARVAAVEATAGMFIPARSFIASLEEGRAGGIEAIDRVRVLVARRTRVTLERLRTAKVVEPGELRDCPSAIAPGAAALEFESLRALGRFAPFDDVAGRTFLAAGEGLALARGALLETAGAPPGGLSLVVRGAVRAGFDRGGGKQEQLTIHGPGEWAGLVEAIDEKEHPLTLSAAEDSLLFRVPTATFRRWRAAPGPVELAALAGVDRQLVKDQRRANRHLGRAVALERFNAVAEAA